MEAKSFKIGALTLGGRKPVFILGPCVIESEAFARRMGKKLKAICDDLGAQFIFKASYDKANRTSVDSFRGMGVQAGCELLASIGADLGVPVTTDVHSPQEAEIAGQCIDVLQIPAFLCRQTDLLRAVPCAVGHEKRRQKTGALRLPEILFHRTRGDFWLQ